MSRPLRALVVAAALMGTWPAAPADAAAAAFKKAYEAAFKVYTAGRFADAIPLFEKAYAVEPAPEPLYSIARCHDQLHHGDLAIAAYERFLSAAPSHEAAPKARAYLFEALRVRGDRALAAGDYDTARAAFGRAVELDAGVSGDSRAEAWSGLADAQIALDDSLSALRSLDRGAAAAASVETRARLERRRDELHARVDPTWRGDGAGAGRSGKRLAWTWIALGAGGAVAVAATIVIAIVATPPRPPDAALGWFDFRR